MNKKGSIITNFTSGLVWAVIAAIILFLFLGSGGASTILKIGNFVNQVPVWFWVGLILILIFRARK